MSSAASQVILHPLASQSLSVLATTLGRDKLYRAVQYFARFYAWLLLARGDKAHGARWTALKAHLATARKLMRLGKPLEHLQAALRALHAPAQPGEQILSIGRQLAYFGYLSFDTLVWANSIKFIALKPETAQAVNKTSNRFWFTGILLSIAHSLLKAGRLAKEVENLRSPALAEKDIGLVADRETQARSLEVARKATRQQLTIDTLDVWIPATNLGFVHLNDGVLGIFGLITSVIALRAQWTAVNRKK